MSWTHSTGLARIGLALLSCAAMTMMWLYWPVNPTQETVNPMTETNESLLFAADLERAIAEIEAAGGTITQRYGERIIIVRHGRELALETLAAASAEPPADLTETEQLLVSAWRAKGTVIDPEKARKGEGLKWDAPGYEAPEHNTPDTDK